MSDDKDDQKPDTKPLSKRQKQKVIDAINIYRNPASHEDLVFIAREFVLCTLPHSDPGNVPVWGRTNGNLSLKIQPGYKKDKDTGKYVCIGYPYGTIPRLLLVWIITEVLRTKSRRLELGHHLSQFMETLGLNVSNGSVGAKRSDASRLRKQMERLFRSTISFEYSKTDGLRTGIGWLDMQVAPNGFFWWDERDPNQGVLWGSWIEVGEKFHQAILANPYPLDIRVLRHVKDSALGIDLYTILNREAYRANKEGKPRFLAWEWLYLQTGNEYTTERAVQDFRRYALEQIEQILEVHSGLIVSVQKGRRGQKSGLVISHLSTPSIVPSNIYEPAEGGEGRATSGTSPSLSLVAPSPQHTRRLSPETIERFLEYYPLLDPNACKYAFDVWQDGLPEAKKAKHYDRAFLGFASKWVLGKM